MDKRFLKIKVYTDSDAASTEFTFNKDFQMIEETGTDYYDYPLGTLFEEIELNLRYEVINKQTARYEIIVE